MSGRSAYVRKKITETRPGEKGVLIRSRSKSTTSSDNATIHEYPVNLMPGLRQIQDRERMERERDRDITGVGTTNARFLKFSEPAREPEVLNYRNDIPHYGDRSGGSQSGSSVDGRRDTATPHFNRPLEDFAYARARRPAIKTEDVSGIEKSGLRSIMDKKSDGVRRGIAKTFGFKKKDKKAQELDRGAEFRPQSSATVRPVGATVYSSEGNQGYDAEPSPGFQQGSHQNIAPSWDENGSYMSPPPTGGLPALPHSAQAPPIKRWIGAGRPVQRWNKLRKDPELWDPNGDVLVFFGQKGQAPRPNPSFRLSSHIIEATESRYLITLLREGSTEEDIHMPPSPAGAPPMLPGRGHYGQQYLNPHSGAYSRGGQPTPPISEDASLAEADGQISYEMYFPVPSNMTRGDQLRHQITTRNVFALLYHASLVGLSLYQALADLHARLESYMPPESDNVGTILNYLSARGIDDVRNDAETAVSILAWSEGNEVRWEEGWRESFLHCAGMYMQLEACADFKHVTPITRALLERACLETQLRVQAAEERLAGFQYSDMWPPNVATTANASGPVMTSPAKAAADRLQVFLVQYYTREFGTWPPPPPPENESNSIGMAQGGGDGEEKMWLTRTVAQSVQKDFAALYDYLVNRDIVWDGSEARSGRKWMMVSESGNRGFDADTEDLPLTDMVIEFDNKLRFPHIPHPYPLVPESVPPTTTLDAGRRDNGAGGGGMFGGKSSSRKNANAAGAGNTAGGNGGRAGAVERRIQLAYTEATNICILGSDFTHSDLIDAFGKFEKTDHVGEVDPSIARRGRWVLIYGILQTLASVSVDAPNVRYRDNVSYHLSPRLKGAKMPPWKTGPSHLHAHRSTSEEAAHELSHCWLIQHTWNGGSSTSGAESSAEEGSSPVNHGGYHFPLQQRAHNGPRSVAGQSSVTGYSGYHTPGGMTARSVRSNSSRAPSMVGGYPMSSTFSTTGSVMSGYSESDAGSSVRSPPPSTASRKGGAAGGRSLREKTSRRQIDRVDEHEQQSQSQLRDWERQGQQERMYSLSSSSNREGQTGGGGGHGHGYGQGQGQGQYTLPALNMSTTSGAYSSSSQAGGGGGGYGGFLVLDEMMDDSRSFTTAVSGSGKDMAALSTVRGGHGGAGRHERSVVGGGGRGGGNGNSGADDNGGGTGPLIRDFDALDVIDDHAP